MATNGSASTLSIPDALRYAYAAGFRGEALIKVVAIADGESRLRTNLTSPNPDGGTNYGILQIDARAHPDYTPSQLMDPAAAFKAAYVISTKGTNFSAWETTLPSSGANYYKNFVPSVNVAAASLRGNFGGAPSGSNSGGLAGGNTSVDLNPGDAVSAAISAATSPLQGIGDAISNGIHTALLVGLGIALLFGGLFLLTREQAEKAAVTAAKMGAV